MKDTLEKTKREKMKDEAILRLKLLSVHANVITDFKNNGVLNASENPYGFLYWLTDEEKEIVEKVEKEYGGMVYHCIRTNTEYGALLNCLYVSKYEEEWEMERNDLKAGYAFCWVENLSVDWCSEFGTIGIKRLNGGLVRNA